MEDVNCWTCIKPAMHGKKYILLSLNLLFISWFILWRNRYVNIFKLLNGCYTFVQTSVHTTKYYCENNEENQKSLRKKYILQIKERTFAKKYVIIARSYRYGNINPNMSYLSGTRLSVPIILEWSTFHTYFKTRIFIYKFSIQNWLQ
jgi:hypothetical protein